MALRLFTVHLAPRGRNADPLATELVPEGFAWGAFVLGPFWLAWHRLWLGLVLWLVLTLATLGVGSALDFGPEQRTAVELALMFGFGLVGHDLRRRRLAALGRPVRGVVAAPDAETALHRFLDRGGLMPPAAA
jgi:hypothetical protein